MSEVLCVECSGTMNGSFDDLLCDGCLAENYLTCSVCGEIYHIDDGHNCESLPSVYSLIQFWTDRLIIFPDDQTVVDRITHWQSIAFNLENHNGQGL